jgi:hypothetical protein
MLRSTLAIDKVTSVRVTLLLQLESTFLQLEQLARGDLWISTNLMSLPNLSRAVGGII